MQNCGNFDQKFPPHRMHECPYENRIGYPWPEDHIPVKPTGNIGDRRDHAAAPIQVPDEDEELAQGVKSAIRHDANGIVTTEAIGIDDAQTYSVNGESDDEPELIECSDTESEDAEAGTDDENDSFLSTETSLLLTTMTTSGERKLVSLASWMQHQERYTWTNNYSVLDRTYQCWLPLR